MRKRYTFGPLDLRERNASRRSVTNGLHTQNQVEKASSAPIETTSVIQAGSVGSSHRYLAVSAMSKIGKPTPWS
jgi:hypothetical protein